MNHLLGRWFTWTVKPYFLWKIIKRKHFKVLSLVVVISTLMLSMLGKIFNRQHIEIFFLFLRKQVWTFDANGDNLREMSNHVLEWKIRKNIIVICWFSLESCTGKWLNFPHGENSNEYHDICFDEKMKIQWTLVYLKLQMTRIFWGNRSWNVNNKAKLM